MSTTHAVTGAFGYSGSYIATRLLARNQRVITLTNSAGRRHVLRENVPAFPYNFDDPDALTESLRGVKVLYNTYWVRFNHARFNHADAVANTLALFRCAAGAGVERIVHISITNPDLASPLEYFRGKAQLEESLVQSGLSYTILRPTVLFGKEDILINNIAWALRHLPIIGLFGHGKYKLQPIYVDDLARLAVEAGEDTADRVIDAIGPETFTYRDLVRYIGECIGKERPLISVPPALGYMSCALLGRCVDDVIVTRDEIEGLMAGLLEVDSPPAGTTRLSEWVQDHADTLGRRYASELARRTDRESPYAPD